MNIKLRELSTKYVSDMAFSSLSKRWLKFHCEVIQMKWHTLCYWVYHWAEDSGIQLSSDLLDLL